MQSPNESTSLLRQQTPENLPTRSRGILWIRVASFIVLVTAFFSVIIISLTSKGASLRWKADEGIFIQQSSQEKYFVRADIDGGNITRLILTESFPFLHGSLFKIHRGGYGMYEFFQLQAPNNEWISVDNNGFILVKEKLKAKATYFEFLESTETAQLPVKKLGNKHVHIRMRHSSRWLIVHRESQNPFQPTLKAVPGSWLTFFLSTTPEDSIFEVSSVVKTQGVNLGSWFVPEPWMSPSFFDGFQFINSSEASLCEMVKQDPVLAEERMIHHLGHWITEDDFREIRARDLNGIRIPIGYWNIIEDPYSLFAPKLSSSLFFLDRVFDWGDKHGLSILLDFHGVSGSQNGRANSGCAIQGSHFITPDNIGLTLSAVYAAATRYKNRTSLSGIELISNPSIQISRNNHTVLLNYYKQAYHVIRSQLLEALIIFNEPDQWQFSSWRQELKEPEYYNLAIDLHLYDINFPFVTNNISEHIQNAETWQKYIETESLSKPVIVGEWGMATTDDSNFKQLDKQAFVSTVMKSITRSHAWYVWNWKIEHTAGSNISKSWDLQRQLSRVDGLRLVGR